MVAGGVVGGGAFRAGGEDYRKRTMVSRRAAPRHLAVSHQNRKAATQTR